MVGPDLAPPLTHPPPPLLFLLSSLEQGPVSRLEGLLPGRVSSFLYTGTPELCPGRSEMTLRDDLPPNSTRNLLGSCPETLDKLLQLGVTPGDLSTAMGHKATGKF